MADPLPFDISTSALIIVDVQNDFCPGGTLPVPNGNAIIPTINALLTLPWAHTLATQDWHPPSHISFAAQHPAPHNTPFVSQHRLPHPTDPRADPVAIRLWPVHCVADTPGAAFAPGLQLERVAEMVRKGRDARVEMYSAFRDVFGGVPLGEQGGGLAERLRERGVSGVVVVGLAGDYCVRHTAVHAAEAGFATWCVWDAVRCVEQGEEGEGEVRKVLGEAGVKVVGSVEVLGATGA